MSTPNLLSLADVAKSYPGPSGPVSVLKGVDLEVAAGESIAITGPSGSGKTTLLNLIGGLDAPDRGCIRIRGADIASLTAESAAAFRLRQVGLVFQRHLLLPQCTALENVILPAIPTEQDRAAVLERARTLFARAGLAARIDHFPGQLSGGERQRVAVLRALINSPTLLLADEPTGALDKAAATDLLDLLREFRHDGMSVVLVTHSERAAKTMDRQYLLDDGALKLL